MLVQRNELRSEVDRVHRHARAVAYGALVVHGATGAIIMLSTDAGWAAGVWTVFALASTHRSARWLGRMNFVAEAVKDRERQCHHRYWCELCGAHVLLAQRLDRGDAPPCPNCGGMLAYDRDLREQAA